MACGINSVKGGWCGAAEVLAEGNNATVDLFNDK
jgi:hypothetical protein